MISSVSLQAFESTIPRIEGHVRGFSGCFNKPQQVNNSNPHLLDANTLGKIRFQGMRLGQEYHKNKDSNILVEINKIQYKELNHFYQIKKMKLSEKEKEIEYLKAVIQENTRSPSPTSKRKHQNEDVVVNFKKQKTTSTSEFSTHQVSEEEGSSQPDESIIKKLREKNKLNLQCIDKQHVIIEQQRSEIATLKKHLQREIAFKIN